MRTGYWVGLFLACAFTVRAESVPASFNYQGVLRGGSGELLVPPLQRTVDFRLYDSAAAGTLLWGRTYTVQLDTNGLFNVEFQDGIGTPIVTNMTLVAVVAAYPDLYLGLTVEGSTEIAPRQKLLSVPFALMAGDVSLASGAFTASGVITAEKGVKVPSPSTIEGYGTIPVGGIIMWSGAQNKIPDGWELCDGTSGKPDLRDKFIVGAGNTYAVGVTGGVANVTLTPEQLPPHAHAYKDAYLLERASDFSNPFGNNGGSVSAGSGLHGNGSLDDNNNTFFYRNAATDPFGAGNAVDIRPPYYALCFIMRIK